MREMRLTLPQLTLIAGTRAIAGAGLGLLLGDQLAAPQRKAVGWTLLLVGALTTIPLLLEVLHARGSIRLADLSPDDIVPTLVE